MITTAVELYGTAWIFEDYGAEQYVKDSWFDWVGDYTWDPEFAPEDGNGDDTDDDGEDNQTNGNGGSGDTTNGTPGFEVFSVITALSLILIILRRRK